MKRIILTLFVVLFVLSSGVGAIPATDATWQGLQDDGTELEDSVSITNNTVEVDGEVESVQATYNVSDTSEPINVTLDTDAGYLVDYDGSSGGEWEKTLETDGVDEVSFTFEPSVGGESLDAQQEFEDVITVDGTDYSVIVTTPGTTFSGIDVPDLGLGEYGVFVFYALAVGAIILGAIAIYLLYDRQNISKMEQATGYGFVALGSLGGSLGTVIYDYWWALVAGFVFLVGGVIWLYSQSSDERAGTLYME